MPKAISPADVSMFKEGTVVGYRQISGKKVPVVSRKELQRLGVPVPPKSAVSKSSSSEKAKSESKSKQSKAKKQSKSTNVQASKGFAAFNQAVREFKLKHKTVHIGVEERKQAYETFKERVGSGEMKPTKKDLKGYLNEIFA